jgi:hypothetical protein
MATMLPQVPNYLPQGGGIDPFGSLMQGMQAGAQIAAIQQQRAALEQKAALEKQAAEREAATAAELQQLQAVPFEQMSRQQQLRLLQLTNSEASRAFISRQIEQIPATVKANRARSYGGVVNALVLNPEVGVKRLRELAEGEQDPEEKKAIEVALRAAEMDPFVAARTIHGMMDMLGGEETRKIADAVVNNLERVGKPLYPRQPGKPMIVPPESTVLQDGVPIFTAPRRSQLLTPEEEAQKARIALAGRPPAAPREEKDDPRRVVAFRETDAAGNVTLLNKFGEVITPTAPVRGKPSAAYEKTAAQRKQLAIDIDRTINELTEATKKGGLIDQSTGSGIGRAIDVGAAFVGQATPGAIAIGRLQPIADMVLKMVPRFEGPQSDKDTQSYKEAAGQLANAQLPNEIRKQAALEIVRLMKARKSQFATSDMAPEATAPAPAAAPYSNLSNDELLRRLRGQ